MPDYVPHSQAADSELVAFLSASAWPFHSDVMLDASAVWSLIGAGVYENSASSKTFWVIDNDSRVGLVRLFDLTDPTPMFDIRVAETARRRGYGQQTVRWLTAHIFEDHPSTHRVEANTRQDNWAMRRVLEKCGYAKEAHYRQAWPTTDGLYDSVGYAILRSDWATGSVTRPDWADSI